MSQLRLKWMRLKIRTDSSMIFNFIKNTPYSDAIGAGFTKYEAIHNGVAATFNKKTVILEPISDPFGEILEFERVVFDQISFSIQTLSNKICLLTFYNPPKTVKPFIDFLSQAEALNVAYGNLSVDLKDFMKIIRENFSVKVFGISKVKVSNLPVTEKTKATLELNSSGDALQDLKTFVGDDGFKLDKIKAIGFFQDSKLSFELTSSASAVIPEEYISIFNDAISYMEIDKF
ncbi:hypothetical protein ACQ26G_004319 [Yersinia enterocolitica]|uniref:hypothetical protein n=1 Tax=Yersinia kristensenii TaxID=28152 RepID=UPI001C61107B|nr:hypothetical protein [Yersinia kristensenii]EKN5999805.1 hypothetical protein [Yersinia enterocolitica]MBW5831791.1 hypothetical protein [Yersinia kristensenii]